MTERSPKAVSNPHPARILLTIPVHCRVQASRAIVGLQPGAPHRRVLLLGLLLCLLGVIGDGATTLIALRTGLGEEANPAVVAVGNIIGLEPWLLITAVLSALIALPILGKPAHPHGYLVAGGCAIILLAKLALTFSNLMIITGHPDLF